VRRSSGASKSQSSIEMSSVQKIFLGPTTSGVVIATVITGVAAFVGYNMWIMSDTMPVASGFENKKKGRRLWRCGCGLGNARSHPRE
jgi:uncharacterized protein YgiB involved in biofilm formation